MGDANLTNAYENRILNILCKEKVCAEVLPTDRACATFNFLNSEKRFVAAALIPPHKVIVREADIVNASLKREKKKSRNYLLE